MLRRSVKIALSSRPKHDEAGYSQRLYLHSKESMYRAKRQSLTSIYAAILVVVLLTGGFLAFKPVSRGEEPNITVFQLSTVDVEQYTLRMNTWKRPETLRPSLIHHLSCDAVAMIQVVWCLDQGEIPEWLYLMEKEEERLVIEEHEINSLNERFNVIIPPATKGILSIDDDVLRPCLAYDWAFYKWTMNPERLVTFDARAHKIDEEGTWSYQYLSPTENSNRYSFGLTRCAFLHADYLNIYYKTKSLAPIRKMVDDYFNCEDIAMSLIISMHTSGQPPLLADYWAIKTTIELDDGSNAKISSGIDHKTFRDQCLDNFSDMLGLKERDKTPLRFSTLKTYFEYGVTAPNWNKHPSKGHMRKVISQIERWKHNPLILSDELAELRLEASRVVYAAGLVEGTNPWETRKQLHLRTRQ